MPALNMLLGLSNQCLHQTRLHSLLSESPMQTAGAGDAAAADVTVNS